MKKHDIIKLGRVKYKIKDINIKAIADEKNRKKEKKKFRALAKYFDKNSN